MLCRLFWFGHFLSWLICVHVFPFCNAFYFVIMLTLSSVFHFSESSFQIMNPWGLVVWSSLWYFSWWASSSSSVSAGLSVYCSRFFFAFSVLLGKSEEWMEFKRGCMHLFGTVHSAWHIIKRVGERVSLNAFIYTGKSVYLFLRKDSMFKTCCRKAVYTVVVLIQF